jgi:glycerol kinase
VSTYFSAYKFQWMRQHVPEVRQQQKLSRQEL